MGKTEARDLASGHNHIDFSINEINTTGLKPSLLLNVGLLLAVLYRRSNNDQDEEVIQISMVTQVSRPVKDGPLHRMILNPLG